MQRQLRCRLGLKSSSNVGLMTRLQLALLRRQLLWRVARRNVPKRPNKMCFLIINVYAYIYIK